MTAKQYLQQVKGLDNMIEAKLEQVERLRALATRVTTAYTYTRQENGCKDKMASIVCKIVDTMDKINASIDEFVKMKKETQQHIDAMQNENYRLLLELRYVNYKNWHEIADILGFTLRWTYTIHGRALIEFQKALKST